jgi:hypothetical protein
MNDETIRLILDMGQSGKTVDEVRQKLDELGKTARKTADSYEVLTRQVGTYAIATDQVNTELDEEVQKATAAVAAQRALGRALQDTGDAAERAARSAFKPGRAMLESGRVIQDFAQGGLPGILNNIEGLTSALGLGAGLAGALTTVGVAAYIAGPKLKELWDAMTGMPKEKVPEATDRVESLTKAIKANKDAMEALTKQGKVYAYELDILKDRAFKLTVQEKELADAQLARTVGPFAGKAATERAGAFRTAVAEYGGGEKLIEALGRAGVDLGRAEAAIAGAMRGERGMADLIMEHLAGLGPGEQLGYIAPERQRQFARQREQTDAALDRNAERVRERRRINEAQAEEDRRNQQKADADQARARAAFDERGRRAVDAASRRGIGLVPEMGGVRAVQAMQRQIAEQTGVVPRLGEVAEMMKRAQEGERGAMMDFVRAVVEANMGAGGNIAILRRGAQAIRREAEQMQAPAVNGGHP